MIITQLPAGKENKVEPKLVVPGIRGKPRRFRMRRKITFMIAIAMLLTIAPIRFAVRTGETVSAMTTDTLVVTTDPSVLTAGVVSELAGEDPFTVKISDASGNPVDLTLGGTVKDVDVWNNLFKDPHPETLPQYYWVRTDLHNDDATDICNKRLFPSLQNPISIDFSQAREGIYRFKGFVANDVGEFKLIVYTPDRRQSGVTTVKVSAPIIDYAIYNTEDPEKRVFHTPGDPDFIMTAADNRVYHLTTTLKTADGTLIKGLATGVQTCDSYTSTRLTVATTMLGNFGFNRPTYVVDQDWVTGTNISFVADWGERFWIQIGIDYNNDGKVSLSSKEIFDIGGFSVKRWDGALWNNTNYKTFYNTTCTMFDDGTFANYYHFDFTDKETGWGMGCIYNSPYSGCFLFPDLNEDGILNYNDSLKLNNMGQTEFYIFANDVCGITCLLGINPYGNHDVAGRAPISDKDPLDVRKRWNGDGTYKLDFDAFVSFTTSSSTTQSSAGIKTTVNFAPEFLEVGKPASCEVTVVTKDTGKPIDKAKVTLEGAGVLLNEKTDSNGKAYFNFIPQKEGAIKISVDGGQNYGKETKEVQVRKDLVPPTLTIDNTPLLTKYTLVRISGVTEPNATVKVNDKPAIVTDKGIWSVDVVLIEGENVINVVATDPSGNPTSKTFTITVDTTAPVIAFEHIDNLVNATSLTVKGSVSEPCQVKIGEKTIKTSGTFSLDIETGFGPGKVLATATDEAGNESSATASWINYRKRTIQMTVGSKAMIIDGSTHELDVEPFVTQNTLVVPLRAVSEALGATVNYDSKTRSIDILLGDKQVIMQINLKVMIVNGEKVNLAVAPLIKNARTFIPFRAIAEAFGCDVKWASETKEVVITRLWY